MQTCLQNSFSFTKTSLFGLLDNDVIKRHNRNFPVPRYAFLLLLNLVLSWLAKSILKVDKSQPTHICAHDHPVKSADVFGDRGRSVVDC